MKKYCFILLVALFGLAVNPEVQAQTAAKEAVVKITGEVTTPLTIGETELHQFKQTTVVRKDRDANDHTYSGVLLSDLLAKAGVTMGNGLKGENLIKYLLVEASDGYQVLFALPELDQAYTDRAIILADTIDGKPLAPADGPFRIIVQDEKRPARCIKQVIGLKILFAK